MLGLPRSMPDAHIINGKPGPLFPCLEKRKTVWLKFHLDDFAHVIDYLASCFLLLLTYFVWDVFLSKV